jgi:hypothetical protein
MELIAQRYIFLQNFSHGGNCSMKEPTEPFLNNLQEQKEQLQPMYIVYRDNELFQEMISHIVNMLQAMGRKVDVKSFEKGTEPREIKQWMTENKDNFQGVELLCDYTSSDRLRPRIIHELMQSGFKSSKFTLDSLLNNAAEKTILGDEAKDLPDASLGERIKSLGDYKKYFSTLVKHILRNPDNVPQKVIIFEDALKDHIHDLFDKSSTFEIGQAEIDQVLSALKESFIDGGIEEDKIFFNREKIKGYPELVDKFDENGSWLVIDRHSDIFINRVKNAKALSLPEGNFLISAREAGLINLKTEEILRQLEKILEEKFGKREN